MLRVLFTCLCDILQKNKNYITAVDVMQEARSHKYICFVTTENVKEKLYVANLHCPHLDSEYVNFFNLNFGQYK